MKLDLSNKRLSKLPPGLNLSEITEFQLYGNKLRTIPEPVFGMTQLKVLNLAGNPISTLPRELTALTSLESLNLYQCPVTSIPDWFEEFTRLQTLWFSNHEGMTFVTPRLGKMAALRSLDITSAYNGNAVGKFVEHLERVVGTLDPQTVKELTLQYFRDPQAAFDALEKREFGSVGGGEAFRTRIGANFSDETSSQALRKLSGLLDLYIEARDFFANRDFEFAHEAELKEQLPARRQSLVAALETLRQSLEAVFPGVVSPTHFDAEGHLHPECLNQPEDLAHRLQSELKKALRELDG